MRSIFIIVLFALLDSITELFLNKLHLSADENIYPTIYPDFSTILMIFLGLILILYFLGQKYIIPTLHVKNKHLSGLIILCLNLLSCFL